jgi:hypothetical protein
VGEGYDFGQFYVLQEVFYGLTGLNLLHYIEDKRWLPVQKSLTGTYVFLTTIVQECLVLAHPNANCALKQ